MEVSRRDGFSPNDGWNSWLRLDGNRGERSAVLDLRSLSEVSAENDLELDR